MVKRVEGIEKQEIDSNLPVDGLIMDFIFVNRIILTIILSALILIGIGFYFVTKTSSSNIEIVKETVNEVESVLIAEVAGAVEKPGVYQLSTGARVEDLLVMAGGVSTNADRIWMEKSLNRAAKIIDGQKLYIPTLNEQMDSASASTFKPYQSNTSVFGTQNDSLININNATLAQLDMLPGIGPVYGQKIIDQRPYSNIQDLLSKKVIPSSTFEKIKEQLTVY